MNCSRTFRPVRTLSRLLLDRHLLGEEEIARQLLRNGAAADEVRTIAKHVGHQRADHADRIDAGVVIEPAILDREHRFLHACRDRIQRDAPPFLARPGHHRGEQRRIERHPLETALGDLDPRDPLRRRRWRLGALLAHHRRLREGDGDDLARLVAASRQDHHVVAIDRELPAAFHARALRIANVIEPSDQFRLAHALAGLQRQRPREHTRHGAIALAMKPRLDDAAVRHIEIGEGADGEHTDHGQTDRDRLPVRPQDRGPAQPGHANPPAGAFRRFLLLQIVRTWWWPMASGSSSISRSTSAGP